MDEAPNIITDLRGGVQRAIATAVAAEARRHSYDVFSDEVVTALASAIAPFVRERVAETVTPLNAHIAKLEARLAELEARHVLEDCGVWDQAKSYRPGSVVQDHGSRWVCLAATTSR